MSKLKETLVIETISNSNRHLSVWKGSQSISKTLGRQQTEQTEPTRENLQLP